MNKPPKDFIAITRKYRDSATVTQWKQVKNYEGYLRAWYRVGEQIRRKHER